MTYRDQIVGLSEESERRVLAVYAMFTSGQISAEETATAIATIVAAHNSKAAGLADVSLAATIMLNLGRPVATAGLLPPDGDVDRLGKAAATVLKVADRSEVPEAIVGRLARSEPLETAARAYSEGMARSPSVKGWVRNLSGGACQLCRWWWREGRVWPAEHPMPTHKGCACTPKPVLAENIQTTGYTRRLRNAG
ncbi:hypothetical protein AU197_21155 [Mycobacterium sp. IS-1590]|uniref:hypothetical protein n=1 Tax=Mycobacterium sp. IS-1590 TaxID=1772286 RepID=UPI000746CA52|nr:hypothetical protein [Mycobacterium sp. IS-1590]KUI43915.1 hypothetical protein AU197_21155 [Mycobacterium sp. IS-1590]